MRKKIGSLILAVSILSVLMPDTAMAARMERKPEAVKVQEAPDQTGKDKNANKDARKDTSEDMSALLEGSGSETDPYRIQDADQLRLFADMVNGASGASDTGICAVLAQNIDLTGVCGDGIGSWTPVGTKSRPYTGVFDGASFVVSGLYYSNSGASYAGLFGCNSGVIKNLGVAGNVAAGNYTGGVCGLNNGTITGCYSAASVTGGRYTGGVCGCNDGGSVNVCYHTGAVSGSKYVGGVCGYNKNMVADCYNMGTVAGSSTSVGGICGYNRKTVSNCYNTGVVSGKGTDYIGSICGYNHSESVFLNSYYLITDTETENYGTAMTRERFESGEVCWLLNGGKGEDVVWHQTCGAGFPGFGGKTVYQVQMYRGSGDAEELVSWYTNDKNKSGLQTYSAAATENDSGETAHGHVYQEPEWKWKDDYKGATAVFTCQDCGEQMTLEASIEKKTTAASCAAEGEKVYTASVEIDERTYRDSKSDKIAKTGHKPFEWKDARATCEKPGVLFGCWMCPECKSYFGDQEGTVGLSKKEVEEPARGHDYVDRIWDWAPDYSSVEVDLTCQNCGNSHKVKGSIKHDKVLGIYIATAYYKGNKYTDEKPDGNVIAPHTHQYVCDEEWRWETSGNSYIVTALFTCKVCGEPHSEQVIEKLKFVEIPPTTCKTPGEKIYTATVWFEGEKYTKDKKDEGETIPHKYKYDSNWEWVKEGDSFTVTAPFICEVCKDSDKKLVTEPITIKNKDRTDCNTPIIYTATVQYDGITYTNDYEDPDSKGHKLELVSAINPTCVMEGKKKHWKCSVCNKLFDDPDSLKEVTETALVSPATGKHDLQFVRVGVFYCRVCKEYYELTITEEGKTIMTSLDENAVLIQEVEENDNPVSQSSEAEKSNEEAVSDELPPGLDLEDNQKDDGSLPVEEQTGEGGQGEQANQEEQAEQVNQEEQPGQEESAGQTDLGVLEGQPGNESGEGSGGATEENSHDGVIYPAGGADKADSAISDSQEGSAVNLRAETATNSAVQKEQEQMGRSLLICVAVLAAFTGMLLILILRKKES